MVDLPAGPSALKLVHQSRTLEYDDQSLFFRGLMGQAWVRESLCSVYHTRAWNTGARELVPGYFLAAAHIQIDVFEAHLKWNGQK